MKYYLYKYSENWENEIDINGFAILNELEKGEAIAKFKRKFKSGDSIYIGPKQEIEYSSMDELINVISFEEISLAEYHTLKKLFCSNVFGDVGPLDIDFENHDESLLDMDDEDEEEEDSDDLYEDEYNAKADTIAFFIEKEFGIERTSTYEHHSNFTWRPTTKTTIEIIIPSFEEGDDEIEMSLKVGNKEIEYDCLEFEKTHNKLTVFKQFIQTYLEKARQY